MMIKNIITGNNMPDLFIKYYNEINELFKYDNEINGVRINELNNGTREIEIGCSNENKANAIRKLFEYNKSLYKVKVTYVRHHEPKTVLDLYRVAFSGNPIVEKIVRGSNTVSKNFSYIIFKNKLIQFFDDNVRDYYGNENMTYIEMMNNIFEYHPGIYFSIEREN